MKKTDSKAIVKAIGDLWAAVYRLDTRVDEIDKHTIELIGRVKKLEVKPTTYEEKPMKKKRDPDDVAMSIFFWFTIVFGGLAMVGLLIFLIHRIFYGV